MNIDKMIDSARSGNYPTVRAIDFSPNDRILFREDVCDWTNGICTVKGERYILAKVVRLSMSKDERLYVYFAIESASGTDSYSILKNGKIKRRLINITQSYMIEKGIEIKPETNVNVSNHQQRLF